MTGPNDPDSYDLPDADPDTEVRAGALWVDPDLNTCPVVPLGFEGGKVWFALPEGELRCEPAGKIPALLKPDIFVSVAGRVFLSNWRDSEGKFQRDMATQWFVAACRAAGRWDPDRPQRGHGVWSTAEGPIVHAGDAIGRWPFKDGDWTPIVDALRSHPSGPIWLLRPPHPRPKAPATAEDGAHLRELMNMWRFQPIGTAGLSEADALLGWQGVALLGAVPPFRPHVSVSGGAGAGKTTLSRLMQAAGSANAGELLDTFTEAGLRNSLSNEARALYLDEAEPSPDGQGPVEKAMEVLRRMSTGDGSHGRKGDVGGRSVSTSAVGCAYLASIFPIQLGDAMATRMVEIRLGQLGKAKGGADEDLAAAIAWARERSSAFLARAVREWKRYRSDVGLMKAALGELGRDPRGADLVAALASGRRLLLFDEALTADTAAQEAALWAPLLQGRDESAAGQNPGQACLNRIWSINSGQHSKDRHLTLGEVVQSELTSHGYESGDVVLKAWGLRVENNHGGHERPGPWLLVSTNHPALAKALGGTPFANWIGVLKHLADLGDGHAPQTLPKAVRFGLHQSRALAVPLTPWLEKPVGIGVGPVGSDPFEPPNWGSSRGPSHDASHGGSHGA